jgi:hypothetical protein
MAKRELVKLPTEAGKRVGVLASRAKRAARKSVVNEAFESPLGAPAIHTMDQQQLLREKELLDKTLKEEMRELGKNDFWYFITNIVFPDSWHLHYTETLHQEIARILEGLLIGEDFWAFLPRKRRKSYILMILHSLWLIVRDPNIRILLVGAREKTVKPFSRLIRDAFVPGTPGFGMFQHVYSDYIIEGSYKNIRQSMEFMVPNRTIALPDPTFRATYVGVTGAGWRADVVKLDDCVERRNVTSPEMSQKIMTQMMDFYPLLDDTGKYQNIVGAGTRYAYHDPYGRVLAENIDDVDVDQNVAEALESRKIKVMVRHALEDPERLCEHCPKHIVDLYPHNHPTMSSNGISCSAPIHEYSHVLADYKRYMTNPSLGESLFWHQMMNVCLAPSDQKIKPEWFFDLDKPSWPVVKRRVLAIDSADKEFQKEGLGDYMVALMGDFDDTGRLLIRYGLRSNRWTRDEFIRRTLTWCQGVGWWPNIAVKEKFSNDTFLADLKSAFLNAYQPSIQYLPVGRPKKLAKTDWIVEQLQVPMETGLVVWGSQVPRELRERGEFELTNLAQSAYDDVADTLALFFIPKVRIASKRGRVEFQGTSWTPPNMSLYEPHGPVIPPMPDPSPEESLKTGGSMQIIMPDNGPPEGLRWDPPPDPSGMEVVFDPFKGSR